MTAQTSAMWPDWQARLAELSARHRVPGAALAVLAGGEVLDAASGVLNVETGVETTTASVFQLGSIAKVYTATLVMQLVDAGRLDLDEPVVELLDEFHLADPAAARQVTPRHLLTHSSGIEGDHFVDTGRGDDAIARYVATCAELPMSHPVGATCSYCNTGFIVAGRIVERLTGKPWHRAVRERLLDPMGLRHTTTLPEEAIRFRVAHGHDVEPGRAPRLTSSWMLPHSMAPAGSTLCASAADLVAFARTHLDGGVSATGETVLSPGSVAAMQAPEVAIPDPWSMGSHWGLGWILSDWQGRRVLGHDGGTLGQTSFLRLVPDAGVAVALLTNGGHAQDLYEDLFRELMAELCDISLPEPLTPPAEPVLVDPAKYTGTYERVANRIEVNEAGGGLTVRVEVTGPLAEVVDDPVASLPLVPVGEDVFVTREPDEQTWTPVVFYTLPDGSRYVHMGARATRRVTP
jgi:CubicO group peptidase (beta-lactamase class C family)